MDNAGQWCLDRSWQSHQGPGVDTAPPDVGRDPGRAGRGWGTSRLELVGGAQFPAQTRGIGNGLTWDRRASGGAWFGSREPSI